MVARALWEGAFPRALKEKWIEDLAMEGEEQALGWLMFMAGLHDIGKAAPGFQRKCEQKQKELEAQGFDFPLAAEEKHWEGTAVAVRELLAEPPVEMEAWDKPRAGVIGMVLGGHHGAFPGWSVFRGAGARSKWGGERWREARTEIFKLLADVVGMQRQPAPEGLRADRPAALMGLAGLVSVADWIASDEEHFPYCDGETEAEEYVGLAFERARRAVRDLGWADIGELAEEGDFEAVTGFGSPNAMQQAVIKIAEGLKEPGLIIIEAPTGEGKTEAAFYLADQLMAEGLGRGVYVGMPTQATANAMFGRFRDYLQRRYSGAVNLHLLHAYATLSKEYQQLRGLAHVYSQERGEGEGGAGAGYVVAREWFTPKKRTLLAPFGVGTVDQALLAALRTRHVFVRLFGLERKVVIFDEVHAYDTYTSRLIDRLLEWLRELGCSVVLLSATLPAKRRRELAGIYAGQQAQAMGEVAYPRVTVARKGCAENVAVASEKRPAIKLARVSQEELAERLAERLRCGGCAAVVCNTVAKAQDVYARFSGELREAGIEVDLFHARYPFAERQERERRAVERFGRNGQRPAKAVLVATQVIEQSLDVDFDLMVSEMAPVDLLIQRAGRLHRHRDRHRPEAVRRRELWLIDVALGEDGVPVFEEPVKAVYDEYLLLRTWLALKGRERIEEPDDVEALIEAVYGQQDLEISEKARRAWREKLDAAGRKFQERLEKLEDEARSRRVPSPRGGRFDVKDMTQAALEEKVLDDDLDASDALRAVTRWSDAPTVSVACLFGGWEEAFMDREGKEAAPLKGEIDHEVAVGILGRQVRLAGKKVAEALSRMEVPRAWRRNALLRHLRPAFFDRDGYLTDGAGERVSEPVRVRLDDELGIVIETDG